VPNENGAGQRKGGVESMSPLSTASEEALAIFIARDDQHGVADASAMMGMEAAILGDYPAAHTAIENSVAIGRMLGDRPLIAHRLRDLGLVRACERGFVGARAAWQESLAIALTLGDGQHSAVAMVLLRLGILDRLEGDYVRARDQIDQALALLDNVDTTRGDRPFLARRALGSLALAQGHLEEARAVFREQLRRRDTTPLLGFASCLCHLGIVASAEGAHARAARLIAAGSPTGPPANAHEPDTRIDAEDALIRARAALGEVAFESACEAGRAMTL